MQTDLLRTHPNLSTRVDRNNGTILLKEVENRPFSGASEISDDFKQLCLRSRSHEVFLDLDRVLLLSPLLTKLTSDGRKCCPHERVHVSLEQFSPHLIELLKSLLETKECIVKSEVERDEVEELIHALGMGKTLQPFLCPLGTKRNGMEDGIDAQDSSVRIIVDLSSRAENNLEEEKMVSSSNVTVTEALDHRDNEPLNQCPYKPRDELKDDHAEQKHFSNDKTVVVNKKKTLLMHSRKNNTDDEDLDNSINPAKKRRVETYKENYTESSEIKDKAKRKDKDEKMDFNSDIGDERDDAMQSGKQHQDKINKPFHCSSCPETFSKLKYLQMHSKLHTGEKAFDMVETDKKKAFECPNCSKTFAVETDKKKAFECPNCSKTFAHLASLHGHMAMHSEKKSYECEVCSRKFTRSDHFQSHKKIHIKDEDADMTTKDLMKRISD